MKRTVLLLVATLIALVAPQSGAAAIGPDSFGYRAESTPFTFENISGTGTRVLDNHDDATVAAPIGFVFRFYGVPHATAFMSENALITFGAGNGQFANQSFTGSITPNLPTMAVLWDDWTTFGTPDAVYFQTLGLPGARRFVVQWNMVRRYSFSPSMATFQAVLFEGSNEIEYRYLDTDVGNGAWNFGASATVGIRDVSGHTNGRYLQWSFDQAVIGNQSAIRFFLRGPPADLTLEPGTATNAAGEEHCVTATVTDASGIRLPDVAVDFTVTGANAAGGDATTNANGEATFCYTGTQAGEDTISAASQGGSNPSATARKTYVAASPATLVLDPKEAINIVDDEHCVAATVNDAFGNPAPGITVRVGVSGSVTTTGTATTDANGQATFCYTGPGLPGADEVSAYADTDDSGVQGASEPADTAAKQWVLPGNTNGCKVTGGGRITAANGDKGTFGGNAQDQLGEAPKGQEQYKDHGPVQPMSVQSSIVLVVTCSADGTRASVFGQATVNGSGAYDYRIDVEDLGEPGTSDTYRIRLSNGYDSGEQVLDGGNIQLH